MLGGGAGTWAPPAPETRRAWTLGFLVPLRFPALASVPRILALAAGCSVLVEAAQYVLRLDRVSSVDDVLLNAAGAGLAALASRRWWRCGQSVVRSTSIGPGTRTLSRRPALFPRADRNCSPGVTAVQFRIAGLHGHGRSVTKAIPDPSTLDGDLRGAEKVPEGRHQWRLEELILRRVGEHLVGITLP